MPKKLHGGKNMDKKPTEIEPNTKTYELPNKPTIPSSYPNAKYKDSKAPISSDWNVEYSKEWVDHNIK